MQNPAIINSPESPINLTSSETTRPNERDNNSPNQEQYVRNYHSNNYNANNLMHPYQNGELTKRHRRRKDEITDRQYQCPDCDKCYL